MKHDEAARKKRKNRKPAPEAEDIAYTVMSIAVYIGLASAAVIGGFYAWQLYSQNAAALGRRPRGITRLRAVEDPAPNSSATGEPPGA